MGRKMETGREGKLDLTHGWFKMMTGLPKGSIQEAVAVQRASPAARSGEVASRAQVDRLHRTDTQAHGHG